MKPTAIFRILGMAVIAMLVSTTVVARPQAMYRDSARVNPTLKADTANYDTMMADTIAFNLDSLRAIPYDTVMVMAPLPKMLFSTPVYTHYKMFDTYEPFKPELTGDSATEWIERSEAVSNRAARIQQRFMVNNPWLVTKNIAFMEKAPREYYAEVNPKDHSIELKEVVLDAPDKFEIDVKKRHWLRTFTASLQFSQAYVSPNWYQGGNNNLNMIANVYYNVKLNPVYHPNLLFEATMQYKLGMNSAPDDSLRNYSISEDLLQLNMTFGVKAAHRWYYSLTAQFKTQLLNSYITNKHQLNSAFLAPGEFTAGIGMTYNYANKPKTFTFDASIAPIGYNMKICIEPDDELSHATWDIAPEKKYKMNFGSSAEAKILWKLTSNIQFRSRIFVFTDYNYLQADWENTLSMDINRYLSTQIYVHARYDSSTPRCDDPSWHKLQVKEILSFGVAYKFSTI